ncbi:unnamed protein product [Periconia digitata]|uniref:DUF2428 domain-containing protein n=1 Tax=Periconia digitata TaxID=1303443 RepID=A0A9W4XJM3_9PLEO|nr:unnamed protein product [Periconia digitata]
MADKIKTSPVPIPEGTLRELSRDLAGVIPDFSTTEPALGVKGLHAVLEPLFATADSPDLSQSYRAAAYNILCAIIDRCQSSTTQYARDALLDDTIWNRLFNIYLTRSDNAKSKSIRQVLLTLTNVLLKNPGEQSSLLQTRAVEVFLDIICERQDRVRVKPALQGLSHFLQKSVVTPSQLVESYADLLKRSPLKASNAQTASFQSLFKTFLAWIVHHDTSLSAGHVIRNFLAQYRQSLQTVNPDAEEKSIAFWIEPVVETLRVWSDRKQEFKTHVFPYCFQPHMKEYLQFLNYLQFDRYVASTSSLPSQLKSLSLVENSQANGSPEEFRLLLAAIETGKELGIVKDVDYRLSNSIEVHQNTISIPDSIFGGWLSHPEPEVRLAGLYLCVVSSAATRPVTGGVFSALKKNIIHLHADSDANFRRELLSYVQKLFDRLRGSTATLARQAAKTKTSGSERLPFPKEATEASSSSHASQSQDPLLDSLRFITWYLRVLEWDLRLEASYQRRITAVRALIVVLKSGIDPRVPRHLLSKGAQSQLSWVHGLSIPNPTLFRSLLDLMLDPFDDIRDASVSALQLCLEASPDAERKAALAKLPGFINRAEAMMLRTGRADQADGVARAYSLYFSSSSQITGNDSGLQSGLTTKFAILTHLNKQLKETLAIATENLSEAVNGRPVHGTFAAISYILDQENFYSDVDTLSTEEFGTWRDIHDQVLKGVESLWSCVWNILCADAPEGHVPEDLEEEVSLDTKEILSYSWRGLKEASVFLRVLITKCPIRKDQRALLDIEKVEKYGNLCFNQLVELRHRGAFSTVAQTFSAFCRRCASSEEPALRALPEKWYMETLATIQAKADTITRRSGGLPALMTGIVAAEPQPGGKLFSRAMQDLVKEASQDAESSNIEESRLPQVHALNCIKDFFMSSRLSVASEAYLGEGVELAARTLNSKIWPIRNCSLMLFKALIERLLGSDEAQDWKEREGVRSSRFSFDSYPTLIGIIQNLLDPEGPLKESLNTPDSNSPMDLHGAEGVFPALQILRQAAPPEENRPAILQSVTKLLGSPHWHMRDMAARTVTTLHHPHEYQQAIKTLLECYDQPTNTQHGSLLGAKYMLRRLLQSRVEHQVLTATIGSLDDVAEKHMSRRCPPNRSAFLELVGSCGVAMLNMPVNVATSAAWAQLTHKISIGSEYELGAHYEANSALFGQSVARVFFIDRVHFQCHEPNVPLTQDIGDALVFLAKDDVDTCLVSLDTLDELVQLKSPCAPVWPPPHLVQGLFRLILETKHIEVLSKAQEVLADALQHSNNLTFTEENVTPTLSTLESHCLNSAPSNKRSALRLLAHFVDQTHYLYPQHHQTLYPYIARYIRLLRRTIIDTNPFDDRFAAVQSIASLHHLWTMPRTTNPTSSLTLGLAFVLYDLLNDDDEEIRDAASTATLRLIHSSTSTPLEQRQVPILTSHYLASFLVKTFPMHPFLHKEVIRRLTLSESTTSLTPFSKTLQSSLNDPASSSSPPTTNDSNTSGAAQSANLLFATEKQNLYHDATLDAQLWSRVLSSIPPSSISPPLREDLALWTHDALLALLTAAREQGDGGQALGWCSKSNGDVCSLGLRGIFVAGVVVGWRGGLAGGKAGEEVRVLLGKLAGAGAQGGAEIAPIHLLWTHKATSLLQEHILTLLRGVSGVADELGFGL